MKDDIKKFKDQLIDTMTKAFETDGQFIATVFFLNQNDDLLITVIPGALMATNSGKDSLACFIKEKCKDSNMKAVAIIMEINIKDHNNIKIGDGIMLIVSSREGDDVTIFNVDCIHKKVLEQYPTNLPGTSFKGRFSGFFNKTNN